MVMVRILTTAIGVVNIVSTNRLGKKSNDYRQNY